MIKITFNGRPLEISATEERALRLLRHCNWAAPQGHFQEGRGRHRRYILPRGKRAKALGIGEESRDFMEKADRDRAITYRFPKRARQFFASHPRHRFVIVGNPRRINAILHAIDTIRAANALGAERLRRITSLQSDDARA